MACVTCPAPTRRKGFFCSSGAKGRVCLSCKVARDGAAFLKMASSEPYVWEKCDTANLPQFVHYLALFYEFSRKNPLVQLVGAEVAKTHATAFEKLLAFAEKEARDYGFSLLEFSLVRMERAVDSDTRNLWLTLCVAFDMGNFLADLLEFAAKHTK